MGAGRDMRQPDVERRCSICAAEGIIRSGRQVSGGVSGCLLCVWAGGLARGSTFGTGDGRPPRKMGSGVAIAVAIALHVVGVVDPHDIRFGRLSQARVVKGHLGWGVSELVGSRPADSQMWRGVVAFARLKASSDALGTYSWCSMGAGRDMRGSRTTDSQVWRGVVAFARLKASSDALGTYLWCSMGAGRDMRIWTHEGVGEVERVLDVRLGGWFSPREYTPQKVGLSVAIGVAIALRVVEVVGLQGCSPREYVW
ncbi:LOW QUALITY PROTEIN: uncharacterized protein EMH_0079960 [Eimeria mitis]|uniref:Uncharacterized protein n=1 Tax=Eimeria mitis TaxID=44415 RepID=U6KC71_9EIME|nr:LOW QUALITY PROTEIN: uncharacterized protein EMH_0079960 [Eimeria mitis]CDJ33088.1 hypothetical protein EMH_0079960 [Eimeria mitis]